MIDVNDGQPIIEENVFQPGDGDVQGLIKSDEENRPPEIPLVQN
jgi:hypothetical protein